MFSLLSTKTSPKNWLKFPWFEPRNWTRKRAWFKRKNSQTNKHQVYIFLKIDRLLIITCLRTSLVRKKFSSSKRNNSNPGIHLVVRNMLTEAKCNCTRVGRTKRLELARDLTCEYGETKQRILKQKLLLVSITHWCHYRFRLCNLCTQNLTGRKVALELSIATATLILTV